MTRDWRPGRRSQPRPSEYTPWTLSFLSPSAKQGKGWTERPGSCLVASPRLASPRLVSFPSFWIWGNCPNWTWAFSRMMNIPAHLMLDNLCNIRDSHRRARGQSLAILAPNNHRTSTPAHISFYATRGHFSTLSALTTLEQSINHSTATERPPTQALPASLWY